MAHDQATHDALRAKGAGGTMYWAMNDAKVASNGQSVGQNSAALAAYAAAL